MNNLPNTLHGLPTTPSGLGRLEDTIVHAVRMRIDEEVKAEVAKAQQRILERVPEIVAGISLSMMKYVSMQRYGDELRITIVIPEAKA